MLPFDTKIIFCNLIRQGRKNSLKIVRTFTFNLITNYPDKRSNDLLSKIRIVISLEFVTLDNKTAQRKNAAVK